MLGLKKVTHYFQKTKVLQKIQSWVYLFFLDIMLKKKLNRKFVISD